MLLSFEDAIERALHGLGRLGEERVGLDRAHGRVLAADVVEQAGLVRQMRSDNESEAAIEREETLLRELRAKLREAEQAIADAKR